MTTLTTRRPRVKPARSIRLALPIMETCPGVVRIVIGDHFTDYFLSRIPSDFGDGFQLEKFAADGGETYHVNLGDEGHLCSCKGYLAHGHCKHVSGLAALRQMAQL